LQKLALHAKTEADGQDDPQIQLSRGSRKIKLEEYRYWQSRPLHERLQAVFELTQELYKMKGKVQGVPRLEKTLVRIERPKPSS